jgi:hypothetical protein
LAPSGDFREQRLERERERERESVERVQFLIGPRGRKNMGRQCGEARLKEKPRRAAMQHDEAK